MDKVKAEYIWIDGHMPTSKLRSKTKVVNGPIEDLTQLPNWGFDGSSTQQADGSDSDCLLKPVSFYNDPIRGGNDILVMCEVFNADGTPHATNTRALLRKALECGGDKEDLMVGYEQEYTLFNGSKPLGWPENGFAAPQGAFYCGVGADQVYGRDMVLPISYVAEWEHIHKNKQK